jgi:putative DNA primase/helicase
MTGGYAVTRPNFAKGYAMPADNTKAALPLDVDQPLEWATRFHAEERPNLVRQNLYWYDYTGTHYKKIEPETIASAVQTWLGKAKLANSKPFSPTAFDVANTVKMLALLPEVHKAADTYKSPSWLDGRKGDPRSLLPCLNGLFDLESRDRIEHSPQFFCTYCLPLNYDPTVKTPRKWLRTLLEIYDGRKHLVRAQQEVIGYLVSGDRSREKLIWHTGRPRAGKGLIATVERALVGAENTVSFSLGGNESTLGDKHGLQGAENALLIQIPDAKAKIKVSVAATTRLKEISSGDPTPVRPLYGPTVSLMLPGLISGNSNGTPNFRSDTDAICTRLLAFPHDRTFADNPDVTLKNPRKSPLLTVEALTGILNWAMRGLDRLNERGEFAEWPESFEIKREMLRKSNRSVAFIASQCEIKRGTYVEKMDLYHVYRDWCAANGEDFVHENYFSNRLQDAASMLGTELKERRARADDDSRPRDWLGIRLTADNRIKYYERDETEYEELVGIGYDPTDAALIAIKTETNSGRLITKTWSAPEDERAHDYTPKKAFGDGDGEED